MSESRCTPVIALRGSTSADPLAERDDEALMALSASDYRPAFEVLVGRYLLRLTNYCAKFLGCSRTGEELAQEVLIEVWGQRHRYLSVGRFSVFLFTLARNRCLNQARSERRRRRKGSHQLGETLSAEAAVQGPDQLDLLLEQERQRRVWTALRA